MKIFFAIGILLSLTVKADSALYLGAAAIEKKIEERLMPANTAFSFDKYTVDPGLAYLMGTWECNGLEHFFRNGLPNAMNTLIWMSSFKNFAQDLSSSCQGQPKVLASPVFAETLASLCQWPKDAAKSEKVMRKYWLSIMGYDAPETEFLAWREFFLKSSYKKKNAVESVQAMTMAILMNPYFLVGQ